jgi:ribosomal protein S18 acetylase RimI-like enzyme
MADVRVVRAADLDEWRALDGEANVVGDVRAFIRPDERCFLRFGSCRPEALASLVAAVADEFAQDLYVTISEKDEERRRLYETLGFSFNRRENEYLVPTDPDATRLRGVEPPPGFGFMRADEVDEERLRVLDDELRQDVPGTHGWKWDEAGFRAELEPPTFDPTTYLIAVEQDAGEYAGIVRVWNNPQRPRLGFIGVRAPHRRRGLAKALLAEAFAVLHERGKAEVSTEVDEANIASVSLIRGLGARRTGGSIELIRRFASSRTDA